jgi:hypothetical protein
LALIAALVVASGCATSVEYAPPPEEVVVRADGSPYRGVIEHLAVSRDGRFVAFDAPGAQFGLGDRSGVVVYDRESDTGLGVCEPPSIGRPSDGERWELSEDARYVMIRHRRCDLVTGEVVDVERFPESAYYGSVAYFKDGSGAAFHDANIPGIRVVYYDGRDDVGIPLGLAPSEGAYAFIASDRWGRHLFVSGLYGYPGSVSEPDTTHWLVSVPDRTARSVGADELRPWFVNQVLRPGAFSDDGSTLHILVDSGTRTPRRALDVVTLEERPSSDRWMDSEAFDDDRFIGVSHPGAPISPFWIELSGSFLTVFEGDDDGQRLLADLSAYRPVPGEALGPWPDLVVTAPASHEVFLSIPLFEREGEHQALVVVPVPPPRERP